MFYKIYIICKIDLLDTGLYHVLYIIVVSFFYMNIFIIISMLYIIICLNFFYYK